MSLMGGNYISTSKTERIKRISKLVAIAFNSSASGNYNTWSLKFIKLSPLASQEKLKSVSSASKISRFTDDVNSFNQNTLSITMSDTCSQILNLSDNPNANHAVITDMKFGRPSSTYDIFSDKLAISLSNGSLYVMSLDSNVIDSLSTETPTFTKSPASSTPTQKKFLKDEWHLDKVSSCINKICWDPSEKTILATANRDGVVRIIDTRTSAIINYTLPLNRCNPRSSQCYNKNNFGNPTDICFDPFHANM